MQKKRSTGINLLIIGGGGTMAAVFLSYLKNWRDQFGDVLLLDKDEDELIKYKEVFKSLHFFVNKNTISDFLDILNKNKIKIVLDLSNAETEIILSAVLKFGKASYVNTSFGVAQSVPLGESLINFLRKKEQLTKKSRMPHILFSGMNPGVVNIWAQHGINNFGKPIDIIEFEFDNTNYFFKKSSNVVTWCVEDFLDEAIYDSSEIMVGKRRVKHLYPNSLKNLLNVSDLFRPIYKIPKNIFGGIMAHEECITLADKNDISFRYIYAYNQPTFKKLLSMYDTNIKISYSDVTVVDASKKLIGEDAIALRLEYNDKYVYYFNSVKNRSTKKHTATSYQVIVGVYAALAVLIAGELKPGIFFPEDLINTSYTDFIFNNLETYQFIQRKNQKNITKSKFKPNNLRSLDQLGLKRI